MVNVEDEIKEQVVARMKHLLFDDEVSYYQDYETFKSNSNRDYQFLIWKLHPENFEKLGNEIQEIVESKGHHCIPGAWDMVTCNRDKKMNYKVIALYKP